MNEQHQGRLWTWLKEALRSQKNSGLRIPATETLAQAVDALDSTSLACRVAAIGALGRIARDADEEHWLAIETLTAYLRSRSPWPDAKPENSERVRTDIQAAISALGRRSLRPSPEEAAHRLDLRRVDLRGIQLMRGQGHFQLAMFSTSSLSQADLRCADFEGANLQGADLSGANLGRANLRGAHLQRANLRGAKLNDANLWDATLDGADLRDATLCHAGLVDACLRGADLAGADLRGANVKLADLRSAKGLACEQLTEAAGWQRAYREESLGCGATIPR